jgi:hypothetical protein
VSGAGITEAESVPFSVLNAPTAGAGVTETESVAFSLLNAPVGIGGISEASSYFSVLNRLVVSGARPSPSGTEISRTGPAAGPVAAPIIDPLADSDGDGLPDWLEMLIGTDPQNPDSDCDGLNDFEELFVYRTNPLNADSDGDGFSDGLEVLFGSDPLDAKSTPVNPQPRRGVARANEGKGNANGQLRKPTQGKSSRVALVFRRAGLLLPFRSAGGGIRQPLDGR